MRGVIGSTAAGQKENKEKKALGNTGVGSGVEDLKEKSSGGKQHSTKV